MIEPRLEVVAAVAANGVIGRGGQLPWHLPDDLKHFKNLTLGHACIMGRRTFDEVGKPLPGRRCIVVSKSLLAPPHPQSELARSIDEAIGMALTSAGAVYIIGGAEIFAQALPRVRVMQLTELDEPAEGDTYFPDWDRRAWRLVKEIAHGRDDRHAMSFRFCTYERV
jgi:dihydrofolate reductase